MKGILLSALGVAMFSSMALAQSPKMNIMEEFTSANCPPCAATNPGLWALMQSNKTKIFLMKYQHKIPGPDVMYNQNAPEVDNRASYYSVNYNPFGKINGAPVTTGQQYNDHPGYFTQAVADALPSTSAFQITIQANMNTAKDSITATVTVKCTQNFSGTTLKLRAALIESIEFATAPGGNGEKEFENVMRKMYPAPDGTALNASWTSGQTQTFTLKGAVPAYVNKTSPDLQFVAFIQDDANKKVEQAGVKPLGGSTGIGSLIKNEQVTIYPNPVANTLNIALETKSAAAASLSITNLVGQQVSPTKYVQFQQGNNTHTISTETLTPGIYFLNIETAEGNLQRKFVKK